MKIEYSDYETGLQLSFWITSKSRINELPELPDNIYERNEMNFRHSIAPTEEHKNGLNDPSQSENAVLHLKDSGSREVYQTGAQRDNGGSKGRMDLIAVQGLLRLSRLYEAGANKYKPHNWESGMPISRYVDAAMRHLVKYMAGCDDEDHLAAVAWNVFAVMHHEDQHPDMQDIPTWQGRVSKWVYKLDLGDDDE